MPKSMLFFCLLGSVLLNTSMLSAQQGTPSLGIPLTPQDLENFDQIIEPNGNGLPAGNGSAATGEQLYRSKCQSCHGAEGEGLSAATQLVGGSMSSTEAPIKTVGSFWPHATTIFDFIRRAMPANEPKSLTDEEVYQATAYVLFLNDIISKDMKLDRDSLLQIKMPNRDGFIDQSHIQ